ncbi:putative dimeric alpha-beta barrel [Diaporthe ampelina]|uniref:Putative dimeric alpha-beta barrel n=1 Tax=Diaporthe ampelina TaxID=1214573 RepID=A0A0G2FD66_9PEZI|nr:putative dimeric alpha-beta barrel [Diaporthe ampelina]
MASSTPRTYEWLVVVPDKPGALAKRLEVRPQHFEGLTKLKESGAFKMGGAVLEEMPPDDEVSSMKFSGSTLMVVAESKQAVVDLIKDDIYVKSGVWDLEKAMIWPAKIAFRFP